MGSKYAYEIYTQYSSICNPAFCISTCVACFYKVPTNKIENLTYSITQVGLASKVLTKGGRWEWMVRKNAIL